MTLNSGPPGTDRDMAGAEIDDGVLAELDALDDNDDDDWQGGLRRLGIVRADPRPAVVSGGGAAGVAVPIERLVEPDGTGRIVLDTLVAYSVSRPGLPDSARRRLEHAWAPATIARYRRDWEHFDLAMRAVRGLPHALAATDVDVVAYLDSLATAGYAMNTIRLRRASIDFAYRLLQIWPPTRSPLVDNFLAGTAVEVGTAVNQKAPLPLSEMREIVRQLPFVRPEHRDPTMRRDQLLIALGWASALRPSTLVGLDVEDLVFEGRPADGIGGMHVRIRRHKTDQTATGAWIAIPWATDWTACPARLAYTYTRSHRRGPLFRHVDKAGTPRRQLHPDSVARILKPLVAGCLHLDPSAYSATSLRAGFITEATRSGVAPERIAAHTRHVLPGGRRTSTLDVYRRSQDPSRPPVDPWGTCALSGGWY